MATTFLANEATSTQYEPVLVTLAVNDPEVLHALSELPEGTARTNFLVTALKVGVLSLRLARGTFDADGMRREGERIMDTLTERLTAWRESVVGQVAGTLTQYFDPQQGTFTDRVHRLTSADGDLAMLMQQQTRDAEAGLTKLFEKFIGENSQLLQLLDPSEENRLVQALNGTLATAIARQNEAILSQFNLNNKESALVRFMSELSTKHGDLNQALSRDMKSVVAEFSLDKEDSALSRLVARVEDSQRSVTSELSLDNEVSALSRMYRMLDEHQRQANLNQELLAAKVDAAVKVLQAKREEAAKGTRHGLEFEAALGNHLRPMMHAVGDILEEVGSTTGIIPNCKVGDYVATLGPEKTAAGARIVIEAKESASYDLRKTLEEADLARRNRQAGLCVFVHSTKTASAGIPRFQRFGKDIVVQWAAEDDSTDMWLQAALMAAHAISMQINSNDKEEAASFETIDSAMERVRKYIEGFEEISTAANTTKSAAERILNRARIMKDGLDNQVQLIWDEFIKVKHLAEKS
jgi:hypothetical protein